MREDLFHEDGTGEYKSLSEALAACETGGKIVVKRAPSPNVVAGSAKGGVFPCNTPWEKVEVAWRVDDYALVWKLIGPLAASGHAKAKERLSWMKQVGYGTASEGVVGLAWLRKRAERGDCEDFVELGNSYRNGYLFHTFTVPVPKDIEEAVSWFRRAAQRGCYGAAMTLAQIYRDGDGVKPDSAAALGWFAQAAKEEPEAEFQMGLLHERGQGIPKNPVLAFEHYRRAASRGDADGMHSLGRLYEAGQGVEADRQKALEWYRKAGNKGHEAAPADLKRLRTD